MKIVKNWYQIDITEVLTKTKSQEMGLTMQEAKHRLQQNGKNELPRKKQDSVIKIFFRQLFDPIV